MKLFFAKGLLLFLSVTLTLYWISRYVFSDTNNYLYALQDKYKRAEELKSPKLILVGGSSFAFGINSEAIQDSLHIPVVNMGLHAALGISYFLAETELVARPGDIVVWSFECNESDEKEIHGSDENLKAFTYHVLPAVFNELSWNDKLEFLRLKYFYLSKIGRELSEIYQGKKHAPILLHWLGAISSLTAYSNFEEPKIDSTKICIRTESI